MWKCWFWRRGENRSTRRKPLRAREGTNNKFNPHIYSCFKNGFRQPRKVLWVVLSSLFFKKNSNNGTSGQGRNLWVLKESNKKWIGQLQCQERCIDHIPHYFSGLSRAHLFWSTFLEIAVYGINIKFWTWATLVAARRVLSPLLHPCSPKMVLTVTLLFHCRALMKYGPLFTLSFLCVWFRWCHPSIQFVLCLCLYDGFLTMIDLNHLALLADLALSSDDRATLNWYCSVFSGCGSLSVFLSYRFWNRDNMNSFHIFCTLLAAFSLVGFLVSSLLLKQHIGTKKIKVDTPDEEERWDS